MCLKLEGYIYDTYIFLSHGSTLHFSGRETKPQQSETASPSQELITARQAYLGDIAGLF